MIHSTRIYHGPSNMFSVHRWRSTRKVAADDHELFMQQQTRNAEAYARKIKDVWLGLILDQALAAQAECQLSNFQ